MVSHQKKNNNKAKEDRVNEMASKHELNGGRKETRSNLSYLGSLQTLSVPMRCFKAWIPGQSFLKEHGVEEAEF